MEGVIIKNISNDYVVRAGNNTFNCKARGKFRKDDIIPLVGDRVIFDEIRCYITKILPRKNVLIRPSVANIDQAIIVTSVKEPNFSTNLLDKFLAIISYNNIEPIICLTKLDLLNDKEKEEIDGYIDYYKKIGYTVIDNKDKKIFKNLLKDKLTVFTGQSGAGKSTLINLLDKSLKLKTGTISKALGRGKHTTRCVELFNVFDGLVVDTPGFSSLDFGEMSNIDIRDNMREMFDNLEFCKYRDCMHINEDGCMVKKKVDNLEIMKSRYENYLKFVEKR